MRPNDPLLPLATLMMATCNVLNLANAGRMFYPNQDAYTATEFERKLSWLGERFRVLNADVLAVQADGKAVTTIEGVAQGGQLAAVQEAFAQHHGLQCGYCTPGMVMSALDLLAHGAAPDEQAIRHALAGNICRCTGYTGIVASVQAAAAAGAGAGGGAA